MFVLALLLLAGGIALSTGVIMENTDSTTLDVFGTTFSTTQAGVFICGAAAATMVLLGLWLLRLSAVMGRRRRAKVARAQSARSEQMAHLEAENRELAARLEDERADHRDAVGQTDLHDRPDRGSMPAPADDADADNTRPVRH
jgi:hypothetical protein